MSAAAPLPRVEAVLTTYAEPAAAVERTVRALLAQTHPPSRIWVVDDGSPEPVDLSWAAGVSEVAGLRLDGNRGISAARNAALDRCEGPLVAVVNVDVLLDPDWLETCARYLAARPDVGACCTAVRPACPGRLLTEWRMRFQEERYHRDGTTGAIRFAAGHATLFDLAAVRAVGGYDPAYQRAAEDADLSFRLARTGRPVHAVPGSGATSFQTDTLGLLASKHLRNLGWSLAPLGSPDAALREIRAGGVARDLARQFARNVARNVARGRVRFVGVDVAVTAVAASKAARSAVRRSPA